MQGRLKPQSLKELMKQINEKYKNDPYWTYSDDFAEDLVAESRGLTPAEWKEESESDKAKMMATYNSKRKMSNYERFHFRPKDT